MKGDQASKPLHFDDNDFESVSRDATALSYRVGFCDYLSNAHLGVLDEFDDLNRKALRMVPPEHLERLQGIERRLRSRINLLRAALKGTLGRCNYLSKRGKAQVDHVCSVAHPRSTN